MPKIAGLVEEMTGLRCKRQRLRFSWLERRRGDRPSTRLQDAGFEMSLSLKAKWRPDLDALELCRQHGRDIARQWALAPLPETITRKPRQSKPETTTCAAADPAPKCNAAYASGIYDPALGEPLQDASRRVRRGARCAG